MKRICEIKLKKDNWVEDVVLRKDENGAEIKVLEKINKTCEYTYFLGKPSFNIKQELNFFYESTVSECVKRGILSILQLRKRFVDDGDILSRDERKNSDELWKKLWDYKAELFELAKDPIKNEDKIKEVDKAIIDIFSKLQKIEEDSGTSHLYDHTAERIADNRTVIWLMLHICYKDLGNNKHEPVFGGGSYEERLKKYEELENDDTDFSFELIQKLLLATQMFYLKKAETPEDFNKIFEIAESQKLFTKK